MLKISSLSSSVGAGKAAVASIPKAIMEPVTQVVPYFDFAAMLPALLSMLFQSLATGLACCSDRTYVCSKFWIAIALPFLLIALAWYGLLLAAGFLSDQPIVLDQLNKFTVACSTALPSLTKEVDSARTALADAEKRGATSSSIANAKAELLRGEVQLEDFAELCNCLNQVPTNLRALVMAGLLGVAAVGFALVCINGLCFSEGCCRKPRKNQKVAQAPTEWKEIDDDISNDDTELMDE